MARELKIKIEQDNSKEIADKQMKDWEVEEALRILVRAEEIKKDKELMALIEPKMRAKEDAIVNASKVLYGNKEEK